MSTKASEAHATEARTRAEANFKKEQRAKEGAQAMQEYQANSRAIREKTERLKALRLAKQAADQNAGPVASVNGKPAAPAEIALKGTHPRRKKKQQPH